MKLPIYSIDDMCYVKYKNTYLLVGKLVDNKLQKYNVDEWINRQIRRINER